MKSIKSKDPKMCPQEARHTHRRTHTHTCNVPDVTPTTTKVAAVEECASERVRHQGVGQFAPQLGV